MDFLRAPTQGRNDGIPKQGKNVSRGVPKQGRSGGLLSRVGMKGS